MLTSVIVKCHVQVSVFFIRGAEVNNLPYTALASQNLLCVFFFCLFFDNCLSGSNLPVQSLLYCARYAISHSLCLLLFFLLSAVQHMSA